ncbi:uncharacterized protein LOC102808943 [Saccoglossus kowalevskii]|uniref:Uncharacterized protein LOC102808943 n=1 Tax=Saccoglossus kowalevskii TaxID=10224 RepID=A0ABM0LZZ3_SACKO|nr:PREDICTED: uncharacterized protein LOC102808943 [Saccoglossus kowalevskii]
MSDLPRDRLEPTVPFTYSAVDYFGPFYVKEGHRELKRYGVLFTCLSSHAIHIETANSLITDSFLNAYCRFIGCRGPVHFDQIEEQILLVQKLNDELLRTLLVEAEAIVNSRPLTYTDVSSTSSLEPLSPSHILTLKSNVVLPPPGEFQRADVYCHHCWRRVQYLANEFWSCWKTEFLLTLHEQQKWVASQPDLQKGL